MSYGGRLRQYGHLEYGREDVRSVLVGDALRAAAFPKGPGAPVTPLFRHDLGARVQLMSFDGVSWYPMQAQMAQLRLLRRSMRLEERADARRLRFWSFRSRLGSLFSAV